MKTMTVMDIFKAILDKIVLVVIIPFLTISVASYVSYCVLEPTYTATTTMYVLDKGNSDTLQYSDLTTSALLIADYRELAVSSRVKDAAAKEVGLENLRGYKISVSSASNTRIIEITVVGKEPAMTANVANAIADNLSACIMDVMRVENISVIDSAIPPVAPSGPDKIRNISLAGLVGLALAIGIVLFIEMVNTTIKTAEDVSEMLDLPVLARVPLRRGKS